MDNTDEIHEFKKDAPTLFGIKDKGQFVAPEAFFEELPHQTQEMVQGVHSGIQIPFWKGMLIALPLIAVIIAVSGILIKMTTDKTDGYAGLIEYEIQEVLEYADAETLLAEIDVEDLPDYVFNENDIEVELEEIDIDDLIMELRQ